jgi:hypothetical protein
MLATVIVIVLIAVVVFGLLIFWLMRRSQTEVPQATDARAARQPQVVGTDEKGAAILDTDEPAEPPRDDGAFESLLQDEIHDRGMQTPRPGDEA